ncbi:MAG TPA: TSUP family transporter, partial [Novosphingobium sp.]|nr:TSUP family transporter [Novosphingobium sp.]
RIIAVLAVLATPAGMALLAITPPDLARLMIAAVAIAAFVIVLLPRRPAGVPRRRVTVLTGLSSGILSGFAAMPGVPVAPYYLGRAMAPSLARASMMLIFFAVSVAGCTSALALGIGSAGDGTLAILLVPAILLGNWLGARAFGRISPTAWRWFAGGVLGASALGAVLRAL